MTERQLLKIEKAMLSMASATSQVSGSHLATFAGDLAQAVLAYLPFDANRLVKHLPDFEAFDVFGHVARVRLGDLVQHIKARLKMTLALPFPVSRLASLLPGRRWCCDQCRVDDGFLASSSIH